MRTRFRCGGWFCDPPMPGSSIPNSIAATNVGFTFPRYQPDTIGRMKRRTFLGSTLAAGALSAQTAAPRAANQVRSIMRLFTSDVEDKAWFNDREMWPRYLDMLAAN